LKDIEDFESDLMKGFKKATNNFIKFGKESCPSIVNNKFCNAIYDSINVFIKDEMKPLEKALVKDKENKSTSEEKPTTNPNKEEVKNPITPVQKTVAIVKKVVKVVKLMFKK